ncbi:hypothetical protein B0D71_08090 [Pseudomonas laurylsulfativorans]|uniref:Uncharacterized protein n=1 Tax=Pseudomonas laurylsulfativorans TaxID=1943631 RepID=A0A2S3VSC2_9PSED|nr:hypothetical protein B0D71_08090 [Pseudomonas laurylsulfativorans]
MECFLWRGGLPPLRCAAVLKPATRFYLKHRTRRFYDCFAAERGQAPPPQCDANHSSALSSSFQ